MKMNKICKKLLSLFKKIIKKKKKINFFLDFIINKLKFTIYLIFRQKWNILNFLGYWN